MSATQEGVESSIHDRLMAKLAPEMESAEPIEENVTEDLEAEAPEAVTDEVADEEEVSVEAEPSESEAQDEEPSDAQEIELSHIAEYLGATEDQFTVSDDGALLVKTKIDGVEGQAKFSDLLKSYQLEGHLNKQSTEVAEAKKALQSKLAEADQQIAEKVQQLEDLSQLAYNDLLSEYNRIDWEELRVDDPAEYTAKQLDFQNRQAQIGNLYQKAIDQREELKATDQSKTAEKIAEESTKLLQAYPAWADPEVLQKEWTATGDYAAKHGYSPEDYQNITDHRVLIALDKARKFDSLNQESQKVTKLVRKAPKIAKPGSTAAKIPSKQMADQKLKAQIKRDGGGKAVHDYFLSKI